jgi:hypothetical protein
MAGISVGADSFLRKVGGGYGVGGANDRVGREPAGGVAGKRMPADEYIASLPARAAFIGERALEMLTSLPPIPQPKGQGAGGIGASKAGGVGIGLNTIGRTGFNVIGGVWTGANNTLGGVDTSGGGGIGTNKAGGAGINALGVDTVNTAINTIGAANPEEVAADTEDVDETDKIGENDEAADKDEADGAVAGKVGIAELTPEALAVVNELRTRDREVRSHEQAHISAGGAYIRGGASYQYQRGPDNKSYAVGGEVGIDTAPVRDDPGATVTKMQAVRAAALAPNDPSAQDRAVAAAAARHESMARADLSEEEKAV